MREERETDAGQGEGGGAQSRFGCFFSLFFWLSLLQRLGVHSHTGTLCLAAEDKDEEEEHTL